MSQKSQCSFLEKVMAWNQQTCMENLDDALPRIISKMEESAHIEESVGILKIICQSFLQCVPSEELEDRVFSRVCKLACGFIDSGLNKISLTVKGDLNSTSEELTSAVVEFLEWLMDTASCVECCVKHVLSLPGSVELSSVQSLPFCAVHILKESYTHCKNSMGLYGDLLEHIGEPLSDLFKRTHSLQISLVGLLDKICITGAQLEDHVHILCSVCTGLYETCDVVASLDVKLVISLWKAIVKVCSQYIALLRDRFDVCPLINLLCKEIRQGYKYLFELCPGADPESLGDDKAFTKSSKILGFQMKVIVALLREFSDYLGNCESNVLDLLLLLHSYLPPSLCAKEMPAKFESQVRVQIVNATAPILGHLVGSRVFRSALTVSSQERTTDVVLPQLLVQLMVLDILPKCEADVIDHWLSPVNHNAQKSTRGLLSAIFESAQQCEVEIQVPVMLPGIMVSGKPQRQVSLYEHTVTHICGFIGACPAKHFSVLENTLLENVLGSNHLLSLLAMDCWCFLVRYGTASTCRDQVQTLVLAFKQLSKTNLRAACKLNCLIQRLMKFLSPEHQSALVKQFPPQNDPHLWVALTTSCLSGDLAESVRNTLITWGLSVLQGTEVKASEVFNACKLFTDILVDSPLTECMSSQLQVLLVGSVCNIWAQILTTPQEQSLVRQHLIVRLLYLTRQLLQVVDTGEILKVLTVVQASMKVASNPDVALAAAHFLSGFGALRVGPSFQSQVLNRLPQILNVLMTHPNPLVHHRALEAFVQFARQTVHEEVIPACVQGNEALIMRIEHFQNKVPYQSSLKDLVLVDYLKSQMSQEEMMEARAVTTTRDEAGEIKIDQDDAVSTEKPDNIMANDGNTDSETGHPAKRARLSVALPDITVPEENMEAAVMPAVKSTGLSNYQTFLDTLSTLAKDVELENRRSGPPPLWFVDAAKEAVTRISDCISPDNNWFDKLS